MDGDSFDPLSAEPIARKKLVMFYLIDVSGSMDGEKIGIVNQVMEEVVPEIRNVGGADSDIFVAVLTFGSECRWMYPEPISVESFSWSRLGADGMTPMGAAFTELNSKMSRNSYLQSPHLSFSPVVFLLSDGYPTDVVDGPLSKLKENKWFRSSLKIALGVGNDFDKSVLEAFTGNPELVLTATTGKQLAAMIRFASVTSSTIGSRSMGFGGEQVSEESCKLKEKAFIEMKNDSVDINDIDMDDSGW